jgi:hypothetical protein
LSISPGDRAPDAPGLDADGNAVRLFDFFRGPQFTLLRLFANVNDTGGSVLPGVKYVDVRRDAPPAENPAAQVFVDAFGHLAAAYGGGNGECVLVRPDGYVGWIGLQKDFADLKAYPGLVLTQ